MDSGEKDHAGLERQKTGGKGCADTSDPPAAEAGCCGDAPVACITLDASGTVVSANPAFAEMVRLRGSEIDGSPLGKFLAKPACRTFLAGLPAVKTARSPVSIELDLHRSDGRVLPVQFITRPVPRGKSKPVFCVAVVDMSGHRAAEEKLMLQARLLALSHDAVIVRDMAGRITHWNEGSQKLYGWSEPGALGQVSHELLKTRFPRPLAVIEKQLLKEEHWEGELLHTRRDGGVITVMSRWQLERDSLGDPALILEVSDDITARKRAEEELRHVNDILSLAQRTSGSGVWDEDCLTGITFVSPECRELFGWKPGELVTTEKWLSSIHPQDRELCRRHYLEVLERGEAFYTEFRTIHPVRGERWLLGAGRLTRNAQGKPVRLTGINLDITERKRADTERERLMAALEKERARLAMHYAVVQTLAQSPTLKVAAPQILRVIGTAIGWEVGTFWTLTPRAATLKLLGTWQQSSRRSGRFVAECRKHAFDLGKGLPGKVWAARRPIWVDDFQKSRRLPRSIAAQESGLHAGFGFPIIFQGRFLGVIEFFHREPLPPMAELLETVSAVGSQVGQVILRMEAEAGLRLSNRRLESRVRERTEALEDSHRKLLQQSAERSRLEQEILRVTEREKRRLGQDLHDGLCQELAGIAFMGRALANKLRKNDQPSVAGEINKIAELINKAASAARDIARGLHPVEMDAGGLMSALHELAARTNGAVECRLENRDAIPVADSSVALNLYRIAREALQNAVKHAQAKRITIGLSRQRNGRLVLRVKDDGIGISKTGIGPQGLGLHMIRYRAQTIGASVSIEDVQPHGTQVTCSLPA